MATLHPYSTDIVRSEIVVREVLADGSITEISWEIVTGTLYLSEDRKVAALKRDPLTGQVSKIGPVPGTHTVSLAGKVAPRAT